MVVYYVMKKLCNFRLDPNLITEIDLLDGTRTFNVTKALQLYLQSDTQKIHNVDIVALLTEQIKDLRSDKKYLQGQVNALMLVKMPLLSRIKLKLLSEKKEKKGF